MVSKLYEVLRDIRPPAPQYLPKDYPDLTGKIALVTGSNTGIGYETAKALLKQNASVIFVNRSKEKAEFAAENIKKELGEDSVHRIDDRIILIQADLANLDTIKPAVEIIKSKVDKIHFSILNAGVMKPPAGSVTTQGYELQFGTNVIGHHLLQKLLDPLVLNAVEKDFTPRIVWLASSAHWSSPYPGGIKWDTFKDGEYAGARDSYGQSKTGNIYQAYIKSQQWKEKNVISVAVHPGYLASDLARSLPGFAQWVWAKCTYPPVYGSYSVLYGALSPDVTMEKTGGYIGPWGSFRELRDDIKTGLADGTAQKLWDYADNEIEKYL